MNLILSKGTDKLETPVACIPVKCKSRERIDQDSGTCIPCGNY